MACIAGNNDIITVLYSHRAESNSATTDHGWTPLHLAAKYNHADTIRKLVVERKIELDAVDKVRQQLYIM